MRVPFWRSFVLQFMLQIGHPPRACETAGSVTQIGVLLNHAAAEAWFKSRLFCVAHLVCICAMQRKEPGRFAQKPAQI